MQEIQATGRVQSEGQDLREVSFSADRLKPDIALGTSANLAVSI